MVCVSFRFVTLNKIRITGDEAGAFAPRRRPGAVMSDEANCRVHERLGMRPAVSTGNQTEGRAVRVASSRGTHPDANV
jgi:hypothetical protein